ncbi:hypothetical protein H8N01_15250 [Streptomyces sp. AC536]|uniref:hypothetical protein n=1 Tax=Streptomyces buecherae TaxID=2763006 RepID=UPI00164D3D74|nr:hypothetical protein [Streptomyces buecherae]MBC3983881.1 hypothetical protein [Streptomyces buecherae]QNJ41933.1 hypothetical protein H7H31_20750 [Streptomyces buecherae]
MLDEEDRTRAKDLLRYGRFTEELLPSQVVGEWCKLDSIPKPPPDVHAAAGNGRLRPGHVPLGFALLMVLAAPLWAAVLAYALLEGALTLLVAAFRPGKNLKRARGSWRESRAERKAVAEHGLDRVFDGDWGGAAGQFLLRYYTLSTHSQRLVVLVPGAIAFLGPTERVGFGKGKEMQVLQVLSADQAVIEGPPAGLRTAGVLRLRFADDTWVVLRSDTPSDIHALLERELPRGNPEGYALRREVRSAPPPRRPPD